MPRRQTGPTSVKPPIGDVRDPDSLYHSMRRFLAWRTERQYSTATVRTSEDALRGFVLWCDERGLGRPQDITRPILERYQRHLFLYRKEDGQPLSSRTQRTRFAVLRAFFSWLAKQNHILYNPASDIDLPRIGQRLPKHILDVAEVESVLAQPDLGSGCGVRDRAIMETFYSTGIRRMEMANLGVFDVDHVRGAVMIRQGKGNKDRVVPIGARALEWVAKYRDDVRPELVAGADPGMLFLTQNGEALTLGHLSQIVRGYIAAARIGKTGSCHLFRHTMATLMLENGADIRYVQAMLGHANMNTTQIYTQVSIRKLKDIHTATHPGRIITGAHADRAGDMGHIGHDALLAALDLEADEEAG